jgi:hypothetical protein
VCRRNKLGHRALSNDRLASEVEIDEMEYLWNSDNWKGKILFLLDQIVSLY